MKTLYCIIASLILSVTLFGQAPPVLRQALTTNTAPVNPTNPGQIPIWQGTFWSFGTNLPGIVVTNLASGDLLWTNDTSSGSGVYRPTAYLTNFFLNPTVADGATAEAVVLDTRNGLGNDGAKLLALKNKGTNYFTVTKDGGIEIGPNTHANYPAVDGTIFAAYFDTTAGDVADLGAVIKAEGSAGFLGELNQFVGPSYVLTEKRVTTNGFLKRWNQQVGNGGSFIRFIAQADVRVNIWPDATTLPYLFDTMNLYTDTTPLFAVRNNGSERFRILADGDSYFAHTLTSANGITNNGTYQHSVGAFTGALFVSSNSAGVAYWSTNVNNIGVTNLSVYNNVIFNGSIISNFNRDILWTNDGVVLKGSPTGVDPNYALRFGQWVGAGAQADYNLQTNVGKFSFAVGSNVLARGMGSVSFGNNNHVNTNANWSTIAGGQTNVIGTNAHSSFIGGGGRNIIFGPGAFNSVIVGGTNNLAQILNASDLGGMFIGGGGSHVVTSNYAVIVGGFSNDNITDYAFIGGGINNTINDVCTRGVLVGGEQNSITDGTHGFIGGGKFNGIGATSATAANNNVIVGGTNNFISPSGSADSINGFIGSGAGNEIRGSSHYSVIGGGRFNLTDANTNIVIGGGNGNIVTSAHLGHILGGTVNSVEAQGGFVGGGSSNRITGAFSGAYGNKLTNALVGAVDIGATELTKTTFTRSNVTVRTSFATAPDTVVTLAADNQVVDATLRTHIRLASDSAVAGDRTFLLTGTNVTAGAHAILEWTGTNAGELVDDSANSGAGNIRLSATWTPTQYDTLSLIFNGTDWIETARATN